TTPSLTVQNKDGADVTVTQTGTKLANIGKMTITDEGLTTELISEVPAPDETIPADSYTVIADRGGADRYVDSETNVKINELNAEIEKQNRKIGETAFTLYDCDPETGVRSVRNGETNLGDLCADAARAYYNAEIAILNGGGIRKTIQAGDIRYLDLMNTLPFGNSICVSKVTGQQILDYLENNVSSYPKENGGFPNVSGIEYTIDKSIESTAAVNEFGEFTGVTGGYRVNNVLINCEPLDKERLYTLASSSYLIKNGGDGYIISGKSDLFIDEGVLHADALADYIENDLGGIIPEEYSDPYGNGRIKVSDGTANEDEKEQEEKPVPEPQPLQPLAAVESSGSVSVVIPGRAAITKNVTPTSGNAAQSVADTSSASAANAAPTAAVPASGGENPATGAAVSSAMIFSLAAIIVTKRKQ
ncbi:MAG: 5'-nucleotidase C-terminal domain-containing protein, partial [Ruminococcus sp.]|nr:5'-nucleotidase C-terminal domain-containing protein [Ruminococcus sp.]